MSVCLCFGFLRGCLREQELWKRDWATCGLQYGRPQSPFPYAFERNGVRYSSSRYNDLIMLCCDDTQSDYRRSPLKAHHTHQTHTTTKKTAVQVVRHTLRQHLATRQTQPPTTNPIHKLALDHRNHRLHLPTLTLQPARLDKTLSFCEAQELHECVM